jgi:hypothetical protein
VEFPGLGGMEFLVGETPDQAKSRAVDGARRVDLKESVNALVKGFSGRIDSRLSELSKRVESQFQPLAHALADVAVAKKELAQELVNFSDELSALLNLNQELDPIEIEEMFTADESAPVDDFTFASAGDPLNEAVADVRREARRDAIRHADAALAGEAIEGLDADYPIN